MGRGAAVGTSLPPGGSARGAGATTTSRYETLAPPTMTARYERVQVWGIDCPERLTWRGGTWEPGGEYVRTIALKNVSTKTLKLKYRMPKTKYFELEFPEVITLSPGMSASVDVTFRPIKTEQYEDFVEFKVRGIHPEPHDTFRVAIAALLPVTSVALAPAVDLGYGAVRERIAKDFAFVNDGDEPFEYEWKIPSPCAFALSPLTGRLKPGETGMARAEFTPEDASVSVLRAALVLNGGVAASETKISAVGKFPYVRLSERVVDFGDVVVGKTTELCVWLVNQSVVGASYAIERVADDALHDHVFRVGSKNGRLWDGAEGRIDASGKEMIKLVYTPSVPGTFSTETFKFITPGGNVAVLLLKGTAIGPKVSLSLHKINFNSAEIGKTPTRTVQIENDSDVSCHWQINSETLGVFSLDADRGVIPPKSAATVTVTFTPIECANYHKRVVVTLRDAPPLAFDAVGTSYDSKRRPAPMYLSHVEAYRARCALGLISPGQPPIAGDREPYEEEVAAQEAAAAPPSDTFGSLFEPDAHCGVSLDVTDLDFGACSTTRLVEAKTVVLRNDTPQKLVVFWGGQEHFATGDTSAKTQDAMAESAARWPYAVTPDAADVRPGETQEFKVTFRPSMDNRYYTRQLECFAYVKTMRSFRQVTADNFVPPWTTTLRANGHTFRDARAMFDAFMPKCHFSCRGGRLFFPPTVRGERAYLTVALINDGDTAVGFEFPTKRPDATEGENASAAAAASPLRCFPSKGHVMPHSHALVTFRFDARDTRQHDESIACSLNGSEKNVLVLNARAQGFVPSLVVGDEDSFVFKPTCVGAITTRDVNVVNKSRIDILYEWAIPEKLAGVLAVSPASGTVKGGETLTSTWNFSPREVKRLAARVPLVVRVPQTPRQAREGVLPEQERVYVSVGGEGLSGALTMQPRTLTFGTCLVDKKEELTIELYNQSAGMIRYRLECVFAEGSSEFDADVSFDAPIGQINARAVVPVVVSFVGRQRVTDCEFRVVCHTVADPKSNATTTSSLTAASRSSTLPFAAAETTPPETEADLPWTAARATADFPTLRVTDAACEGVAKPLLWKRLSINALNAQLATPPTPAEHKMAKDGGVDGTIVSSRALAPLSAVATGMGVHVEGAPATVTHLEVTNVGTLPADWRVLFRNELEVEAENWVELSEPDTEVDAHQMWLVDNGVVKVYPRRGHLEPGQKTAVTITYAHDHVGAHWLTALLTIADGRSVRLELGGRTVALDAKCLDLGPANAPIATHVLSPVRIGEMRPPTQSIELRNPCADAIRYVVDVAPAEALNRDAWGFPVLRCLNPSGVVPAFGVASVDWIFQPAEEKVYETSVEIKIHGGENSVLTIRGAGVSPLGGDGDGDGAANDGAALGDIDRSRWIGYRPTPTLPPATPFQLSTHACAFGEIPSLAIVRRVVALTSCSDFDYDFKWNLCALAGNETIGALAIEPAEGVLNRGESVMIKVIFTAGTDPRVFDGAVRCELTPTTPSREELEYEARLAEEAKTRPVAVAEQGAPAPSMPTKLEKQGKSEVWVSYASKERMSVLHASTENSAITFPELTARHRREHEKTLPKPPPPPADHVVALGVEGIVQTEVAFREEHGAEAFDRHFIPTYRPDPRVETLPADLTAEDAALMIAELLRETARDPEIQREFDDLEEEEIPFYLSLVGGGAPARALRARESIASPPKTPDLASSSRASSRPASAASAASPTTRDSRPATASRPPSRASVASSIKSLQKKLSSRAASMTATPNGSKAASRAASVAGSIADALERGAAAEASPRAPTPTPTPTPFDAEAAKAEANPEFRTLAEWALEETLYNVVRELHADAEDARRGYEDDDEAY